MHRILSLLLIVASVAIAAEDEKLRQAARDEAAPKIAALIKQMGSEDFDERRQAASELYELGWLAREALEPVAKGHADAEVRTRARQILDNFTKPGDGYLSSILFLKQGFIAIGGPDGVKVVFVDDNAKSIKIEVSEGIVEVTLTAKEKTFRVVENPANLVVSKTSDKNEVKAEYLTLKQLKEADPETFAFYTSHCLTLPLVREDAELVFNCDFIGEWTDESRKRAERAFKRANDAVAASALPKSVIEQVAAKLKEKHATFEKESRR